MGTTEVKVCCKGLLMYVLCTCTLVVSMTESFSYKAVTVQLPSGSMHAWEENHWVSAIPEPDTKTAVVPNAAGALAGVWGGICCPQFETRGSGCNSPLLNVRQKMSM